MANQREDTLNIISQRCLTPAGYCNTERQVNSREVAQLLRELLPSKHRALDSAPALHKFGVEILFYILSTWEAKAGGSEVQLSSST